MDRAQKEIAVKELAEELKGAEAIFAVDYRGISVPQAAELRSSLRESDTRFRVVKNRLTLRAADAAGTDEIKELLSGPTALALVGGDPAQAAKIIFRLGSEWELLEFKGGVMEGEALDPDSFEAVAKLPGREALNAQLAGVVASPLTGLIRGLGSMVQGLASQLQQIAEQGLVSGEPPARDAAAPAEEQVAEEVTAPAEEAPAEEAPAADAPAEEAPAEAPAADGDGEPEKSPPDPEPEGSPEETSDEQAPETPEADEPALSEDAPGASATAEGDADPATDAQTSDNASNEQADEQTSEDSDDQKEDR